ncbi:CDP-alcohol phosphatidyltransferase (macronuclear) [Tetrahymena thermophila SB210]|uniref:CDP-alcohol phosphatidyltransferase n=1 Tax=Tetrahymena thermophila (strain SB210) TaxID=312017 RepID=I7MMT5_TETTS|nr:CDP-alcohol phosphatidyltransferase [Tetrahymena thermophila SB210]EAS06711.3 CDP-alcohol phosphatidyltransferase [Tetrahymena thermophila SB210]|eukprot:XP_001026953.3 CDP-alcohol phosphatidyltransferase [Tetrahymena thermophila SB210]
MFSYKYIPVQNEQNLKLYKYTGCDNSLLYNYILGPIAELILKITPAWIAPNTLTLMGFLCVLIPHLILWYMFPDKLEGDVPRWYCLFVSLMHLVYMNFDNLDGKQARKTGNSSPMGLLFDHGCDAMIVFVQGITLATCMGFGNNYLAYLVYASGAIPFYITTLEEYYTDIMYLPLINGAAEGCFAVGFFIFVSGLYGPEFWGVDFLMGMNRREFTLFVILVAGFVTCLNIFYRIYLKKGWNTLVEAVQNTGFSFFIHGAITYIFFFSPANIGYTHTRLLMYVSGLHWCKSCSILQMCHVSRSDYFQFRKASFLLFVPLLGNTIAGQILGSAPVCEVLMLKIVLVLSLIVYFHMVISSINQFCAALNIRTFYVKPVDTKKTS